MNKGNKEWVLIAMLSLLAFAGCGLNNAPPSESLTAAGLIVQSSLGTGRVGQTYSAKASVSGGEPAYTWSVSSGALPSGISLTASTGVLSGTPTATGTSLFSLTVTDSSASRQQTTQSVSLTIVPNTSSLAVSSDPLPSASVGAAYTSTLQASGGRPSYTWSIAAGSLPPGFTLDAATGLLSGTPATAGTYSFIAAVQDNGSPAEKQTATLSLAVTSAPDQTVWYVRADGGTRYSTRVPAGQCDGMGDARYPGSGVNQHCAFNDIRFLWQDGSYAYNPPASTFPSAGWVGKGGDTYIVRGSIAAGSTPYRVGWDGLDGNGCTLANNMKFGDACYRGWRGNPYAGPPTPPAGTAARHTRILGENWQNCHGQSARTPVVAGYNVGSAFNFSSSYIDFQCFDISDKSACFDNPSCVEQDFGTSGINLANSADHLTMQDVRVHGMKTFGMLGPSGDGDIFRYLSLVGNGGGGWNADAGNGTTGIGTLLVQHYEIKWNGCGEEFPIKDALPYANCTDQNSGGYGDGFGTATLVSKPGWQARFDEGEVAYNTQDGLDALHLIGTGSSMTVTRTLAYANMGQQVKIGGAAGTLEDSVIVGNCNAMANGIPGTPIGYNLRLSNFCRAGNQPLLMTAGRNSTTEIRHNTIAGAGALLIGYACDGFNGVCDSTALVDLRDNILLGNSNPDRGFPGANFVMVQDDTYQTPAACKAAADGHHSWTTDGMIGCNNDVFLNAGSYNDHNIYFNVKDSCSDHNGRANLCMSPGLVSEKIPAYGYPDVRLSPHGSAAFHAGINLSTIPTDYSGADFYSMPSIGALETGSSLAPYLAMQ